MVIMALKSVPVVGVLVSVSPPARIIAPRAAVKVVSPCSNPPGSAPVVPGTAWIKTAWTRLAHLVLVADGRSTGEGRKALNEIPQKPNSTNAQVRVDSPSHASGILNAACGFDR